MGVLGKEYGDGELSASDRMRDVYFERFVGGSGRCVDAGFGTPEIRPGLRFYDISKVIFIRGRVLLQRLGGCFFSILMIKTHWLKYPCTWTHDVYFPELFHGFVERGL